MEDVGEGMSVARYHNWGTPDEGKCLSEHWRHRCASQSGREI